MAHRRCWFSANCVRGIQVVSMKACRSRIKSPHREFSWVGGKQSGEAQRYQAWCYNVLQSKALTQTEPYPSRAVAVVITEEIHIPRNVHAMHKTIRHVRVQNVNDIAQVNDLDGSRDPRVCVRQLVRVRQPGRIPKNKYIPAWRLVPTKLSQPLCNTPT